MVSLHALFHRRAFKSALVLILIACCILIIHLFLDSRSPGCDRLCSYTSTRTHNQLTFDETHFVHHYSEFVCPQNFRNLADWVYGWPDNVFDEQLETTSSKARHIPACLPSGSIIYVKADHLDKFFRKIYPYFINKFVLITGQSDVSSPDRYLSYLEHRDSKIIHWFGQNADIDASRSKKFSPIPIGLNCYVMADAIRDVHLKYENHTFLSAFQDNGKPLRYIQPFDITQKVLNGHRYTELLLLNFQPGTDWTGLRSHLWRIFCNDKFGSTYSTCISKSHGVDIPTLPTVYARSRHYPFWLSPRGNGLDTHRTWEALYLDAIPIVWNSTLNTLYTDLPVVIVNDWTEINEQFLREKLREISANKAKNPSVYQFDKLRHIFWQRIILNKSRHLQTATTRQSQCWRAKATISIT